MLRDKPHTLGDALALVREVVDSAHILTLHQMSPGVAAIPKTASQMQYEQHLLNTLLTLLAWMDPRYEISVATLKHESFERISGKDIVDVDQIQLRQYRANHTA